jgi:hypothetical protein
MKRSHLLQVGDQVLHFVWSRICLVDFTRWEDFTHIPLEGCHTEHGTFGMYQYNRHTGRDTYIHAYTFYEMDPVLKIHHLQIN